MNGRALYGFLLSTVAGDIALPLLAGSWEIAMTDETADGTGASERGHRAGGDVPVPGPRRRMSANRKQSAVLRLLKGESIELPPTPRSWLRGAPREGSPKTRPAEDRDAETARPTGPRASC